MIFVQSSTSTVSVGSKKKCTKNVSVVICDVIDEEVPDTLITIDDDSPFDPSCVTTEVLNTL